jgi:hypothetical protein
VSGEEKIQAHPAANVFPLLEGEELAALTSDVKKNGLQQAIVTLDGLILDGRNRYRACRLAGVTPWFEEYAGDDPVGYVISANLVRRHLDESQRAMCGAKLAGLRPNGRPSKLSNWKVSG